ncbi:MAG: tetratricopeptide repeat protein [Cyclobacteriaceae bacterium]
MACLVSGFEYDIFISYRHNDNKSGWVTEFVKNLQEELAATIKDPISVYFDSNPHDGLLETHIVGKSLEGKLKCLIFIPIISQTYCDPKSFAWQHEFCAFNKMVKEDEFGRDIKLKNGNVASRILPVKVHDLDADDLQVLKDEIGGALRPIEFIYKEPGVNRSLRPNDEVLENFNRTKYRNQVNKVANAIKEIIAGLKNFGNPAFYSSSYESVSEETKAPRAKSIVVLPFEDMSPEKDQEYFCDGLSEELINALTKVKNIHVVARTSAFSFKGKEHDVRKIGKKLKVESLLEGSVRKAGNQLRITAQLINVGDGFHLWSERYDREVADVFAIQDEISLAIVENLKIELLGKEKNAMMKRQTIDIEAYNLYLKGRYFWNKWTPGDFRKSIELFQQAIRNDPMYAMAYVSLAEARYHLGVGYWGVRPLDMLPDAIAAVTKAIEIDPGLAEAHAILGAIKLWHQFDLQGAESELRQSLNLNPKAASAHDYFSHVLIARGAHEEAIVEIEKAIILDPLSNFIIANTGLACYRARKYDKAIAHFLRLQELYPNLPLWSLVGFAYIQKRMFDEAIEAFKQGVAFSGEHHAYLSLLGYGYAAAGRVGESRTIVVELERRRKTQFLWDVAIAMIYSALGEEDMALDLLEQAYEDRAGWIIWLGVEPAFDNIRDHPRYVTLLMKIGLSASGLDSESPHTSIRNPKNKKSIVVLPFENMSSDKENEYFSDGLTEEIIADLSNVHELSVISRSSAMTFKGTKKKVREIAHEVGVRYVLEGSVRKEGSNLRITAQLIDGMSDAHLWAEKYNGTIQDVFEIQEQVSRSIVNALKLKLSKNEDDKIARKPVENIQAYELCLKAQYEFYRFKEDALLRAIQYLEAALEIVGENTFIYGNLGFIYCNLFNIASTVKEVYLEKARILARKIFALQPDASEGHGVLGFISFFTGSKKDMVKHLEKAYEANPHDSNILAFLSLGYFYCGQADDAERILNRLKEIDPFNPIYHVLMSLVSFTRGKLSPALEWSRAGYERNPDVPQAQLYYAYFLASNNRRQESYPVFDRLIADGSGTIFHPLGAFLKYSIQGEKAKALGSLSDEIKTKLRYDSEWCWLIADGYALIHEKEESLNWIESIVNSDFVNYPLLSQHDPFLENIRGEPRFRKLIEKVKSGWESFQS